MDYSKYSVEELLDVEQVIDTEQYPENYAALLSELKKRDRELENYYTNQDLVQSDVSGRLKKASYVFVGVSMLLFIFPFLSTSVSDKPLESYLSDSFIIKSVQILEFTEKATRGRTNTYYELEILSTNMVRYFLRSPDRSDHLHIKLEIQPHDRITLHHLDEFEKNGGRRIVELSRDGETILSFNETVAKEKAKHWVLIKMGLVWLCIGIIGVWYASSRSENNTAV